MRVVACANFVGRVDVASPGIARFAHGVAHVEHIVGGQPVASVASTVTCSQRLRIALSAQISVTRSAPSTPAPARTVIDVGAGAHGQSSAGLFKSVPYGLSLLPMRNRKSSTVGVPGRPVRRSSAR